MNRYADVNTPFAIDLDWWRSRRRSLERLLADMVGESDPGASNGAPLDYIDPDTGEVHQLQPLWVRVLVERAHKPDFLDPAIPLATAVFRTLIENMNRPMSAVEIYRRISRTSPDVILRLLRAAEDEYGIVPILPEAKPRRRSRRRPS